ncbi:MAG: hypothetical protein MK073_02015 [Phycisphaerales bacterium]|nr:hypothetical protein [Phycisphaerales bacterium]
MNYEDCHQNESDWTPEERMLDASLSEAMQSSCPQGLEASVFSASRLHLTKQDDHQIEQSNEAIEALLNKAYALQVDESISSRVFNASVASLPHSQTAVIATIGSPSNWRQLAAAACLLLTTVIAIRFGMVERVEPANPENHFESFASVSIEDNEGYLLDELELEDYSLISDTQELAYADIASSFNSLRDDIALWQSGLLTE